MRKRLAIVGHSEEGLSLIPLLEANPDVEICAVLTPEPDAARAALARVEPNLDVRFSGRITQDPQTVLREEGLVALIDAGAPAELEALLSEAPGLGIQVTTPLIAKLLYAFGPVDASRKPDLLQTLAEILESYNLTVDWRGLLSRILQIAVGATGAERGSLMLHDPEQDELRVEVAIGIERELMSKIRVAPGEGIAGLAFQGRQAILMHGKADQQRFRTVRAREDIESAISAPLIHEGRVLGVLNLAHARERGAFDEEDLHFVEQLAALDAKIIARARDYHALVRDSAQLRAQEEVQEIFERRVPLAERLTDVCAALGRELEGGICHLYLYDREADQATLSASTARAEFLTSPLRVGPDSAIHGRVIRSRRSAVLSERLDDRTACYAIVPLLSRDELLGLLSLEGLLAHESAELVRDRIHAMARMLAEALADALRENRLERETTRMTAITEAAAAMNATQESAELHRRITSSAAMILEAEHAVLRLRETSGRYQLRSYFGSAETDEQTPLFELEKRLSIEAIQQRAPLRLLDVAAREDLGDAGGAVGSTLTVPLERAGRTIGSLSLLGHAESGPFATSHFTAEDEAILRRFAEHASQALEQISERESARHHQRFDSLTGMPNAVHFRERLEQEIARSSGSGRPFLVLRLQIPILVDLLHGEREADGEELVLSIGQELRAVLREFDVIARTGPDTFEILIPEPEYDEISPLLGPLARRVREAIRASRVEGADDVQLEFGYARHPDDGRTASLLQVRARESRITSD